jgi:hypothetical protein
MASTSNKPADSHDPAPEKSKYELPSRKDAADREILPGSDKDETQTEEVLDTTGYVSNTGEDEPAAEGDPDSIKAYKKIQDEEQAAEAAAKESKEE